MYNTRSDPLCFQNAYAGARVRSGKALSLSSNALTLEALTIYPYILWYMLSAGASCLYTEIDAHLSLESR